MTSNLYSRKFYIIGVDHDHPGFKDFKFVNEAACSPPIGIRTGKYVGKHEFGVGIPPYEETPRLVFSKNKKKRFLDAYPGLDEKFFSDRLKSLFTEIDPEAFEWLKIDAVQGDANPPLAPYWMGDVIRTLDCVDEERSDIEYFKVDWDPDLVRYKMLNQVVMKSDLSQNHHVFRLKNQFDFIIVDNLVKDEISKSKYVGIAFREIGVG